MGTISVILSVLGALAILYIIARFEAQLLQIIRDAFNILRWPFDWLIETINEGLTWLNDQISGYTESDSKHQHLIGAILYTIAAIVFLGASFGLILLTLQAMGLSPIGEEVSIPFSADLLAAASLVGMGIFWGLVVFDLVGLTHLAPWDRLSPIGIKVMKGISIFCLLLTILLGIGLGIWRGYQIVFAAPAYAAPVEVSEEGGIISLDNVDLPSLEPPSETQDVVVMEPSFLDNLPVFISGLLAGLESISAVFAGIGVVLFLNYLIIIALSLLKLPLSLVRLVLQLPVAIIEATFRFTASILHFIASLGLSIFHRWLPANEFSANSPVPSVEEHTHSAQPPSPSNNGYTEELLAKRIHELEKNLRTYEEEEMKRQYQAEDNPLGL